MAQKSHNQVLVIIGPTASGKSGLAIDIARKMNGEIISADSRQIYRGMDIGTGKVTRDQAGAGLHPAPQVPQTQGSGYNPEPAQAPLSQGEQGCYVSEGVVHHLLDVVDPMDQYNVTDFQRDAKGAIENILSRGKLPIICGGTGFWVQALVENQHFPGVEPDWKLREELSQLTKEELFSRLEKLDAERSKVIDRNNPVRLIRAIEIALARSKSQEERIKQNTDKEGCHSEFVEESHPKSHRSLDYARDDKIRDEYNNLSYLTVALNPPFETLREKIKKRLDERFDQGMIEEVSTLHDTGVSWERLEGFGLEYKWIASYLQGKATEQEMKEKLYFAIVHYAKRQLTWLRRWERQGTAIHWITSPDQAFEILSL